MTFTVLYLMLLFLLYHELSIKKQLSVFLSFCEKHLIRQTSRAKFTAHALNLQSVANRTFSASTNLFSLVLANKCEESHEFPIKSDYARNCTRKLEHCTVFANTCAFFAGIQCDGSPREQDQFEKRLMAQMPSLN